MSAPGASAGDPARAALALRLGPGARQDAAAAPAADLALARLGTAFVARLLNQLPDAGLPAPGRIPGWTRAALFARLGYQARALARVVESARTGVWQPMFPDAGVAAAEIALGATLPPRALRHLVEHAAIHLNVEWRDLDDAGWAQVVPDGLGGTVAVASTPRLRARLLWATALDLDSGVRLGDVPPAIRSALAIPG